MSTALRPSGPATDGPAAMADALARLEARIDALIGAVERPVAGFVTVDQAAAYAALSCDSIRRLIGRGDLTAYRPVGGRVLIERDELRRVILGSAGPCPSTGRGRHPRPRRRATAAQEAAK